MIEKILSKFREIGNIQFSQFSKPLIAVEDAIEIVQEVAKEYGNGWISCSERLPEKNGYYLTCDEHGNIHTFYHFKDEIYPFAIAPYNERFYQPIAWQPLPTPYKKGE